MTTLKIILPVMLLASINSFAQTNIFREDGPVGIGTTSPTQSLDVTGNILLRNVVNAPGAGASLAFSSFSYNSPGPKISSYMDYADGANSRSRLILSSYNLGYSNELTLMAGNVGIGTNSPTQPLDVAGNVLLRNMSNAPGAGASLSFSSYDSNNPGPKINSYMDYADGTSSRSRLILSSYDQGYHDELTLMSGNVGIGTNSPTQPLDVAGDVLLRNMSNAPGAGASLSFSSYGPNNPGPKINSYMDYADGTSSRSRLVLSSYDHGYNNELTLMSGNVGIGTMVPKDKLSVNGRIRAGEILVESANWPDYVFSNKYELPTLKETEKYIQENGHLPGIPSAAEVSEKGVELGDLNAKLLKKIEELTLHLIEKDKELESEKNRIDEQQIELSAQKEAIRQILLRIQTSDKKGLTKL